MMQHSSDILNSFAPLSGVLLMEICGHERILIENHKGITCYDAKRVHVKVNFGMVKIEGEKLNLRNMSKSRLLVTGEIYTVNFCGGE